MPADPELNAIDRRLNDLAAHHEKDVERIEKEIDRRFDDVKERVDVARHATDDRFSSFFEFRNQTIATNQRFLTRDEYSIQHQALSDKVEDVRLELNRRVDNVIARQEEDRKVVLTFQGRTVGLMAAFGLVASAATAIIIKATGG